MKTLITAVNSKYIHSALAPWYLKYSCGDTCGEIAVKEFTINDNPERVLSAIFREKPDIAAFSCYIWNIGMVLELTASLKKILPAAVIVLGGPEVSYDAGSILEANPQVDYILKGEGETSFRELLSSLKNRMSPLNVSGLVFRADRKVTENPALTVEDLNLIPSPYTMEMLSGTPNRIVYYEASRGCPFSCSYCLSSTLSGTRFLPIERVKRELSLLTAYGVKQVKFVDRTFNCNKKRAEEIFRFVSELPGEINFHFEAAADLFDSELLDILSKAPRGRIQLEIGLQSANPDTLAAVDRVTDLEKVRANFKALRSFGNIHLHLDLIAGLPFESLESFKSSFDAAFGMRPHQLQLGFLKMLKGSKLRADADLYQYRYNSRPPYEVLCSSFISYGGLLELKAVEDLIGKYWNLGRFQFSIQYIIENFFTRPYDFFRSFSDYFDKEGCNDRALPLRELYTVFAGYAKSYLPAHKLEIFNEILKFDFLCHDSSGNLPSGLERLIIPGFKELCFDFLRKKEEVEVFLPEFSELPPKQLFKMVHFEAFKYDVIGLEQSTLPESGMSIVLFVHMRRDSISGRFQFKKVLL